MSSNEVSNTPQNLPAMFQRGSQIAAGGNIGAIAIEQERAIAETQGQLVLAKRFPRSMVEVMSSFLDTCASPQFAATAFYAVPNRGSGPSIRFAEEVARCYGNFVYGHRELSRTEGKSEIEVYAWDMEKNNRSSRQITVMHVTDTKNGPKKLTDQTDIDNKIANVASKQMRGRILALMPKHVIAAGVEKCRETIAGNGTEPLSARVLKMAQVFKEKFGVSTAHLAAKLGHPIDTVTIEEFIELTAIYAALRDGGKASEYFAAPEGEESATGKAVMAAAAKAKTEAEAKAAAATTATPKADEQPAAKTTKPAVKRASTPAPTPETKTEPDAKAEAAASTDAAAATTAAATPAAAPAQQAQAEQEQAADDHAGSGGNDDIF